MPLFPCAQTQDVAMRECASKYDRQLWHYDVETRAIRSLEYCLDYNHHPDGRGNVYANVSRVDRHMICRRKYND